MTSLLPPQLSTDCNLITTTATLNGSWRHCHSRNSRRSIQHRVPSSWRYEDCQNLELRNSTTRHWRYRHQRCFDRSTDKLSVLLHIVRFFYLYALFSLFYCKRISVHERNYTHFLPSPRSPSDGTLNYKPTVNLYEVRMISIIDPDIETMIQSV